MRVFVSGRGGVAIEEVSMKLMDRPSFTEMERGGVYEMDRKTKCQKN